MAAPTDAPRATRGPRGLDRVAEALKAAEGIEYKCDDTKLEGLKQQRDRKRKESQRIAKEIKLEGRKRQRLMNKCRLLPTNDLLECFRIRFENQEKRNGAKEHRLAREATRELEEPTEAPVDPAA